MTLQATPEEIDAVRRERGRATTWVVMPVLAQRDYTIAAIADCLAQTAPVRLLVINQGVDTAFREELERIAEQEGDRVLVWSHVPPLPSLAATWNRALDCVWEAGGEEALVVNNDVRLHADTVKTLSLIRAETTALFVSAVGVAAEQFDPHRIVDNIADTPRGGPDFSCFLIAKACHQRFRFDEAFIPAFCEDLDYHRRLLLAGEGHRIFSVNLPYLHYASATLKALPPADADRIRRQIESVSRAHYAKKWGGAVNHERLIAPFGQDGTSGWNDDTATTPVLQRRVAAGLPPIGCPMHDDQPFDGCRPCAIDAEEYDKENHGQEA